jgi:hypothetical protein
MAAATGCVRAARRSKTTRKAGAATAGGAADVRVEAALQGAEVDAPSTTTSRTVPAGSDRSRPDEFRKASIKAAVAVVTRRSGALPVGTHREARGRSHP